MVFNVTFKNISVLLVEETGIHRENHWPAARYWQTLSHNVVLSIPLHEWDSNSQLTLVLIDTDCIGSHKSDYHTTTTAA